MRFKAPTLFFSIVFFCIIRSAGAKELAVDFEYRPPQWRTAICLPDDPYKTLIDEKGVLLYHFGKTGDFDTNVSVIVDDRAKLTGQSLVSPRVPIVQTERETPNLKIVEEVFAVKKAGPKPSQAESSAEGKDLGKSAADARNDVILVHVTNKSGAPQTIAPKVVLRSGLKIDLPESRIQVDKHETLICTEKVAAVKKEKKENAEEAVMTLAPMTVEPGKTVSFAAVYCGGGRIECVPVTSAEAQEERGRAETFWKTVALPYNRIVVPDKNIQALIDSSIRNIWQAREIKNGLPAFQVGAGIYRMLAIVDGAFILEAANLVGAGKETRAGIAYMLTFQKEDGRIDKAATLPYTKENGIVLWICVRHAMLTQDKEWLRSVWPKLEKIVAFIKHLRQESYKDGSPLNDGLLPPGYVDGGIGSFDQYEYSNVYWNLVGLKAIIQAARWLDKNEEAREWQKEYDDFYATFRKAAARDMKTDGHGNRCLPILMTETEKIRKSNPDWYIYCKGQWSFCHAVYPGQLFEKNDPLVKGNLDNLATYEKEGMIATTGWLTGGIWSYFVSLYGHALLWQGDGQKAAEALYAFANHASPLLAWLEEQGLKDEPIRENGDMPHNWASAEFIRLAVHLLALDRGREMHLFEGLPAEWTRPGMETKFDGIATPFGPLTFSLRASDDGKSATLKVEPLSDPSCEKIVVHLGRWASEDAQATQTLDPRKSHNITIPIDRKGDK